jgi:hypothetical protein
MDRATQQRELLAQCMNNDDLVFSGSLMNEVIHRPNDLLVHADDCAALAGELESWKAEPRDLPDTLPPEFPIRRYWLPPEMPVLSVVTRLRQVVSGPEPRVAPNYVYGAEQSRRPTPADVATPIAQTLPEPAAPGDGPVVGVIDTGVVVEDGGAHPYIRDHLVFDAVPDRDPLDADKDGNLDLYDCHGTFVAGQVLRYSPTSRVTARRALDTGLSDDLLVAAALLRMAAEGISIINLSFTSVSDGQTPPLAFMAALQLIPRDVVVVAAAGNYGRTRPFWPAAFKRVIAVGSASEDGEGKLVASKFSNRGWWVDACAFGENVVGPYCTFDEGDNGDKFSGWARWSGTSFAAPKVAGRIAAEVVNAGVPPRQAAENVLRGAATTVPDLGAFIPDPA